jgi:hypothetical protein
MSETSASRRVLHLVIEGFPSDRLVELSASAANDASEIFLLSEANAGEALEKIFVADTVAVWGKVLVP